MDELLQLKEALGSFDLIEPHLDNKLLELEEAILRIDIDLDYKQVTNRLQNENGPLMAKLQEQSRQLRNSLESETAALEQRLLESETRLAEAKTAFQKTRKAAIASDLECAIKLVYAKLTPAIDRDDLEAISAVYPKLALPTTRDLNEVPTK